LTPLTQSMTRLRDEILALRQSREALRAELRSGSGARHTEVQLWRSDFHRKLTAVRRAWAGSRWESGALPLAETGAQRYEAVPLEPLSVPAAPEAQVPVVAAETIAPPPLAETIAQPSEAVPPEPVSTLVQALLAVAPAETVAQRREAIPPEPVSAPAKAPPAAAPAVPASPATQARRSYFGKWSQRTLGRRPEHA
jgi:hypothetical protein